MKKISITPSFTLALAFTFTLTTHAQTGQWTWMKGDTIIGAGAVYGTQGVSDPANTPSAVYGGASWTDKQGLLWLLGGYDFSAQYHGTLWMHDPATNNWTWMKGPSAANQYGQYGIQGIADPTNFPGGRAFGFLTWTDTSNNLWLYGGSGYGSNQFGSLADLWKYDIVTNEWTWINGDKTPNHVPNYGTKGVPAATNHPGSRSETTCSWTDSKNRLWLFGGFDNGGSERDDVWMYDIATNEWTWMGGSNLPYVNPSYGTQGVFDISNTPGGRVVYSRWIDGNDHLWLFGGGIYSPEMYADLWEYDTNNNLWAWISGTSSGSNNGEHGLQCDASVYFPKARSENRAAWVDACGSFWLFGGSQQDWAGTNNMNDLWVYVPTANQWVWVSGDSTFYPDSKYGTKGVSDPANKPSSRTGAPSWIDLEGNLWLFGGGYPVWTSPYNDLWRYVPDTACYGCDIIGSSGPAFGASDTTLCEKFCIDFFDSSLNAVSWEWLFPGANPSSSTDQNPANICYDDPGTFDVTLITTNSSGASDTLTLFNYITVYTNPFAPTISQTGNTLTSSPADFYQWYLNTIIIPGATNQSITITLEGLYTVIIADSNGCTAQASIDASLVGIELLNSDNVISIYPNPSHGNFVIEWKNAGMTNGQMANEISIEVINTVGQIVYADEEKVFALKWKEEIDLSDAPDGIYFLQLQTGEHFLQQKMVISK